MIDAIARCRRYRRRILEISQQVTALHVAPAFSCIEIVDAIYNSIMIEGDIFIMSKGHGCLAQYVVLEDNGWIQSSLLDGYCTPEGVLGAHPDYAPQIGIHASTGSLGHGLSIAVGQAFAERALGTGARVFCLLSDGEMQEGSTWEAIMMAANLKLSNLTCFIDCNDFGGLERISTAQPAFHPLADKLQAFGWRVDAIDGHNASLIIEVADLRDSRPVIAVCRTVKGRGVRFMENNPIWHYRSPSPEEYQQALEELYSQCPNLDG